MINEGGSGKKHHQHVVMGTPHSTHISPHTPTSPIPVFSSILVPKSAVKVCIGGRANVPQPIAVTPVCHGWEYTGPLVVESKNGLCGPFIAIDIVWVVEYSKANAAPVIGGLGGGAYGVVGGMERVMTAHGNAYQGDNDTQHAIGCIDHCYSCVVCVWGGLMCMV